MKHHYYVELPIPQDVNDTNTVTWGDDTFKHFSISRITSSNKFTHRRGKPLNF